MPTTGAARSLRWRPKRARVLASAGSAFLIAVAATCATARTAGAQTLLTEPSAPDNRIMAAFGWESTWVARLGYARSLGQDSHTTADLTWTFPLAAGNPLSGGRVEAGFNPRIDAGEGFGAAATLRTGVGWSTDVLGERVSWTGAAMVAPGWFRDSWHVAAEVGWRAALVTGIWHADIVEETFRDRTGVHAPDDGPSNGPFGLSSQRLQLGLRAGLGNDTGPGVLLRAGLDYAPQQQAIVMGPPVYTLPFYMELAGDWRW